MKRDDEELRRENKERLREALKDFTPENIRQVIGPYRQSINENLNRMTKRLNLNDLHADEAE